MDNKLRIVDVAFRQAGIMMQKSDLELVMRLINEVKPSTTLEDVERIKQEIEQKYDKV